MKLLDLSDGYVVNLYISVELIEAIRVLTGPMAVWSLECVPEWAMKVQISEEFITWIEDADEPEECGFECTFLRRPPWLPLPRKEGKDEIKLDKKTS